MRGRRGVGAGLGHTCHLCYNPYEADLEDCFHFVIYFQATLETRRLFDKKTYLKVVLYINIKSCF